jgi:hypothetical protein
MSHTAEDQPCRDAAWARELVTHICHERDWPLLEPIKVRKGWFRWRITTNADSIGGNVVVMLNRKREVLQAVFRPR